MKEEIKELFSITRLFVAAMTLSTLVIGTYFLIIWTVVEIVKGLFLR